MVGEEMKGKVFWKAREGGRGASREERQVKKKSRRFILVGLLASFPWGLMSSPVWAESHKQHFWAASRVSSMWERHRCGTRLSSPMG